MHYVARKHLRRNRISNSINILLAIFNPLVLVKLYNYYFSSKYGLFEPLFSFYIWSCISWIGLACLNITLFASSFYKDLDKYRPLGLSQQPTDEEIEILQDVGMTIKDREYFNRPELIIMSLISIIGLFSLIVIVSYIP